MGAFDYFKEKKIKKERDKNRDSFRAGEKLFQQGIELFNKGNHEAGFQLFLQAAKEHHFRARYMVGACYEDGCGVAQDKKQAFEIYTEIAKGWDRDTYYSHYQNDAGIGLSRYRIGLFYMEGIAVPQNTEKALQIFKKMSVIIDSSTAAFCAYRDLHFAYRNGENGCQKDIGVAHEWALKAISAYEMYEKETKISHYLVSGSYSEDYCVLLQFVAYNLEEGRGVPLDFAKGTEYRCKVAELFKGPSDLYFAGVGCEKLGNIAKAKELYQMTIKEGGDYGTMAQEKLDVMLEKQKQKNTSALEAFLRDLDKNPVRGKLLDAAWLYYYGYLETKPSEYGEIRTDKNYTKSREYILRLIKMEVKDHTPLYKPGIIDKTAEELYLRGRSLEKSGLNFNGAIQFYKQAADKGHVEALYRMGALYSDVLGDSDTGDLYQLQAQRKGRPRYNWHKEPTLALVQLAQQQDPEALRDLGRIYNRKKDSNVSRLLFYLAIQIYKKRIDKEDPEAMYACFELMFMTNETKGIGYLWDAAKAGYGKALADLSSPAVSQHTTDAERREYRARANQTGATARYYSAYAATSEHNKVAYEAQKGEAYRRERAALAAQEAAEKAALEKKLDNIETWHNMLESGMPLTNEEMFLYGQKDIKENLEDNAVRDIVKKLLS